MENFGLVVLSIGLLLYVSLFFTVKQLMQRKEYALLHLWLAFIFTMLFPLPILLILELRNEMAMIAGLFGMLYMLMLIVTMVFQTGHLSYSMKQRERNETLWDERDRWMIQGMLGDGFEPFAGVIMNVWLLLLSGAFFYNGESTMGILTGIAGLFIIRNFVILLNHTRNHSKKLKWFQANPLVTNLHCLISFAILILWMTLN